MEIELGEAKPLSGWLSWSAIKCAYCFHPLSERLVCWLAYKLGPVNGSPLRDV